MTQKSVTKSIGSVAIGTELRAIQTSRYWKLAHARHSGHVLTKKQTSYPVLAMLVLITGVFIASWSHFVKADTSGMGSYTVNVNVVGPAPTVAATITIPINGTIETTSPIEVSGTCPLDTYVSLTRNGVFSGVSLCSAAGTWEITSDLFSGLNALIATDYNTTNVAGPPSSVDTITYTPPATTTGGGGTVQTIQSISPSPQVTTTTHSAGGSLAHQVLLPLILSSKFEYVGVSTGQSLTYQLSISGGQAPYAIVINWDDGDHQLVSRATAGPFEITHTYQKPGSYKGLYSIQFNATDSVANQATLQMIAIVNAAAGVSGSTKSQPTLPLSGLYKTISGYIWPTYFIVLLMLISYWLGERREYQYLKPRLKRLHRA